MASKTARRWLVEQRDSGQPRTGLNSRSGQARALGVSPTHLKNIEDGVSPFKYSMFLAVLDLYEVQGDERRLLLRDYIRDTFPEGYSACRKEQSVVVDYRAMFLDVCKVFGSSEEEAAAIYEEMLPNY